jgi:hypothetical protein
MFLQVANVKISGGGPRIMKKKEKSVPRHPLHFFVQVTCARALPRDTTQRRKRTHNDQGWI